MKKNLLVFAIACLFSFPVFGVFIIKVPTDGQCACEGQCELAPGTCVFVGDCSGTVSCTPFECQGNGVCFRTENIILQSMQLVYNGIKRNEFDISLTGMMGTTEGTFPDYEDIYIINGTTPLTNEIRILSYWCNE